MSVEADFEQDDLNSVAEVMSTRAGRNFVMGILEGCRWMTTVYADGHGQISYNVGAQSVGLKIYRSVEAAQPELTAKMLAEGRERQDRIKTMLMGALDAD